MSHRYFTSYPKEPAYWILRVFGVRLYNHYDWIAAKRTFLTIFGNPLRTDAEFLFEGKVIYSKEFPLERTVINK